MSTGTEVNYLEMSDEDVLKAAAPEAPVAVPGARAEGGASEEVEVPAGSTDATAGGDVGGEAGDQGEAGGEGEDPTPTGDQPAAGSDPNAAAAGGEGTGAGDNAGGEKPKDDPAPDAKKTPVETEVQAQAAMASDLARAIAGGIKANGKVLQIRSAEEGVKLMQMGANFTKKMQELQPAMRIVKMLSNNELLDEGKITFLIDLSQKNPAAIQKLLADSEFDPLSVDKAKADSYIPGDHQVTDSEVQFQAALDDLIETPEGIGFLKEIQGQWDRESRQALLKDPSIVAALNHQRSEGIYQVITSEIDRMTALGQIPVGTPFLQAYRGVGEMLRDQGKLGKVADPTGPVQSAPAGNPQGQAPAASNAPAQKRGPSEAAKAAAPVKATTTKPTAQVPNFLAQSDEEFLKTARV